MKITHHPAPESLMSCSAGSQPEAFAAVMSAHMTVCPACQKELAFMESIGVAMFDKIAATPVERDAPVMALRAGEADDGETFHASPLLGGVPCSFGRGHRPRSRCRSIGSASGPGVWQHTIRCQLVRAVNCA